MVLRQDGGHARFSSETGVILYAEININIEIIMIFSVYEWR